ncbi:type I secretion system permease/ATPase [Luminiphilus sp.]|nr:type I secretion system permease/ATPase [Luminiphilus sp.]
MPDTKRAFSADEVQVTSVKEAMYQCRSSFIAAGVFSGAVNLLMLTPAFYMLNVYDKAVAHNSVQTLVLLSLITLVLFAAMGCMDVIRSHVLVNISSRLDEIMGPSLHRISFENAVLVGPDNASSQPLMDLDAFRRFVSGPGAIAVLDGPWVPIYILVLFLFHPLLGWMGVVACLVFIVLAVVNQKTTSTVLENAGKQSRTLNVSLSQELRNAEVASAMGMMRSLRARWEKNQEQLRDYQNTASHTAGFFNGVIKTLRQVVQSAAIGAGALLVLNQEISPGMIIAGSILIGRALQPIEMAVGAWRGLSDAREQHDRINLFLGKFPPRMAKMSLPPLQGRISADRATIVPPGGSAPSIKAAEFECAPGTVFLLMGPSGAGKSSLVKGVLGLWPTASGALRLDGAEATTFDREQLGEQIGYLPQDIELFQGTVKDNIARFGAAEPERVVQAARDAGVHDFVLSLQAGYETDIGLQGAVLSPGQRQRIALARALYGRPKLVVLDEPNSNLDESGEAALNNAIKLLKETESTVIVVSHRPNVLPLVDHVLVLNDGLIVDAGEKTEVFGRLAAKTGEMPARQINPVKTVTWTS